MLGGQSTARAHRLDISKGSLTFFPIHGAGVEQVEIVRDGAKSQSGASDEGAEVRAWQCAKLVDLEQEMRDAAARNAEMTQEEDEKRFWMPDQRCSKCHECDTKFSVVSRRHHCRLCGQVFCDRCTRHTITDANLGPNPKVCNYCYACHMQDELMVQRLTPHHKLAFERQQEEKAKEEEQLPQESAAGSASAGEKNRKFGSLAARPDWRRHCRRCSRQ